MNSNPPLPTSPRRLRIAIGLAAAIAAILWLRPSTHRTAATDQPTFTAIRAPMTINITQSGTIRATQQEIITCKVEGQTTIISLIEEGTRVAPGDLLVELDASALQERLVEQQIRVQNAEASFIRARETLGVVTNQAASDIAAATLNHRFAREDLTQYEEGEYRQQLLSAEARITLAEEELQLAARRLEWSEKLFNENYVPQSERDADRLTHNRAKLDLELAQSARRLLETFTYTRELAKRRSDVEQTERALERARLRASADIIQAEADLKAREAEQGQQRTREDRLHQQIALTRIVAPREGLVVYATSAQANWRGRQEPLEAGQTVRERQELIHLPTADLMMAVIQVHESNLEALRLGLPATVTVDALQGRTFRGRVTRIAPLPDAASMWMNPDLKVYRTEIQLDDRQPALRTGMSCMADILVEHIDSAVQIPIQAVVRRNGLPTVHVWRDDIFLPVTVTLGQDNNRMIQILAGLDVNEKVLLTPPLNAEDRPAKEAPRDDTPPPAESPTDSPTPRPLRRGGQTPTNETYAP